MGRFVSICLITFIVVMCGCDRDEIIISSMYIEDIHIQASKIEQEFREKAFPFHGNSEYYAITVFIKSSLGGCRSYHSTRLFPNSDVDNVMLGLVTEPPGISQSTIWTPGDTIRLEITEKEPKWDGSFYCPSDFYYWYQAISIGFCIPGQYTIDVNKNIYTFTIDGTDGTVRIHETS